MPVSKIINLEQFKTAKGGSQLNVDLLVIDVKNDLSRLQNKLLFLALIEGRRY